jgi:hypothetical protein
MRCARNTIHQLWSPGDLGFSEVIKASLYTHYPEHKLMVIGYGLGFNLARKKISVSISLDHTFLLSLWKQKCSWWRQVASKRVVSRLGFLVPLYCSAMAKTLKLQIIISSASAWTCIIAIPGLPWGMPHILSVGYYSRVWGVPCFNMGN